MRKEIKNQTYSIPFLNLSIFIYFHFKCHHKDVSCLDCYITTYEITPNRIINKRDFNNLEHLVQVAFIW